MNNLNTCNNIRKAEMMDLSRLTEIYNQAIITKQCTCDTLIFSIQERQKWFNGHQIDRFPIWVFETEGKVVGYSYISPYRNGRKALSNVCEISYYIDFEYHRRGIGSQLMTYTLEEAKQKVFSNIVAILLECNYGSIGLLKKFGFSEWGVLPQIVQFDGVSYSHLYYGKKL